MPTRSWQRLTGWGWLNRHKNLSYAIADMKAMGYDVTEIEKARAEAYDHYRRLITTNDGPVD